MAEGCVTHDRAHRHQHAGRLHLRCRRRRHDLVPYLRSAEGLAGMAAPPPVALASTITPPKAAAGWEGDSTASGLTSATGSGRAMAKAAGKSTRLRGEPPTGKRSAAAAAAEPLARLPRWLIGDEGTD